MGSFTHDDIVEPSKETCTKKKKKAAQHNTKSVKSRDIRSMFTEVTRKKPTNTHDISSSSIQKKIVIDSILLITFLILRNKCTMRVMKFSTSMLFIPI